MKEDLTFINNKIIIGKNANGNDILVKNADDNDYWFHLADFPSCHVVIKNSTEYPITNEMIMHCANLTKLNTKYQNVPNIKVHYTQIKNVTRTDIPGLVIIKGKIASVII